MIEEIQVIGFLPISAWMLGEMVINSLIQNASATEKWKMPRVVKGKNRRVFTTRSTTFEKNSATFEKRVSEYTTIICENAGK